MGYKGGTTVSINSKTIISYLDPELKEQVGQIRRFERFTRQNNSDSMQLFSSIFIIISIRIIFNLYFQR